MLDGKTIRPGDLIIGIESSGLHTNGYSLARKVLFEELNLDPRSRVPGIKNSLGAELLKVHISYGPIVQDLLKKFNRPGKPLVIKGLAHITGGGFVDNIPRVLPTKCDVIIHKGTWPVLPIFSLIQTKGAIPEDEMYQVFNMGIGMTVFTSAEKADAVLRAIQAKHKAWIIGEVARGKGEVLVEEP
jgi:phosphoribosylformylglycinamidine cyclo-ligase